MPANYNGFTNRETFTCSLLVQNDREAYEIFKGLNADRIESVIRDTRDEIKEDPTNPAAAKWIVWLLEIGSLDRVNWRELNRP